MLSNRIKIQIERMLEDYRDLDLDNFLDLKIEYVKAMSLLGLIRDELDKQVMIKVDKAEANAKTRYDIMTDQEVEIENPEKDQKSS